MKNALVILECQKKFMNRVVKMSKKLYISGWQALNLPDENGLIADWHPLNYFSDKIPNELFNTNDFLLEFKGIKQRKIPYLNNKTYFVASFARAIADLVYLKRYNELQGCVNDFLNENDEKELFSYVKFLYEKTKREDLFKFMKFELTKQYFKDLNERVSTSKN